MPGRWDYVGTCTGHTLPWRWYQKNEWDGTRKLPGSGCGMRVETISGAGQLSQASVARVQVTRRAGVRLVVL